MRFCDRRLNENCFCCLVCWYGFLSDFSFSHAIRKVFWCSLLPCLSTAGGTSPIALARLGPYRLGLGVWLMVQTVLFFALFSLISIQGVLYGYPFLCFVGFWKSLTQVSYVLLMKVHSFVCEFGTCAYVFSSDVLDQTDWYTLEERIP